MLYADCFCFAVWRLDSHQTCTYFPYIRFLQRIQKSYTNLPRNTESMHSSKNILAHSVETFRQLYCTVFLYIDLITDGERFLGKNITVI